MSKDQYLEMCEQMGEEPNWERCPPAWEDFPQIIVDTVNIFNSLGDRVYPDIGYVGKDFTNYKYLLEQYGIEKHQRDYVFDTLLWLDSRAIDKSQKRIKAEYDRIKNKSGR
jgi:hypothetical protein|tara:strand:- start:484 stop:816 length:333 start_codon:yes stop_codon:yes gene_type:complete